MKMLGVDYGDVRMGFAVCDKFEMMASGLETVRVTGLRDAAAKIAEKAASEKAERIVIGLPKRTDGSEGDRAEKTRVMIGFLSELTDIDIDTIDERFSTVQAHNMLSEVGVRSSKRKKVIDTLSAELILQSYIDRRKNMKND